MAEAFVGAVLKGVVPIIEEQINLAWGLEDELTKLRESLKLTEAFLQYAEEMPTLIDPVKIWLQMLNDVAYKADDVLDEFSYEFLRRKVEVQNQIGRRILNFFTCSNFIVFRCKMANKIKDVLKSLDDINTLACKFGLQNRVADRVSPAFRRSTVETISCLSEPNIVGRRTDVSKILDLLVNPKEDQVVSVVPIVGTAGLGKTTLARLVYNDPDVEMHFDVKFWVCASDKFDVKRILKDMLDHFPNQHTSVDDGMNVIFERLKQEMKKAKQEKEHVKYLLVLDDLWNVEEWEELKCCLNGISRKGGNGVIVTTRSQNVATTMQPVPDQRHQPGELKDVECWSIIKAQASRGSQISQELESIGLKIAKQCQGVPLVARVIAGTICKIETSADAWSKIQRCDVWDSVQSTLKLSFDHLSSPSLKRCFAYCAMFPKNYCFEKEELIQLWMAEGFLGSSMAMEEGNKNLNELLSISLLQDVDRDTCGNILTFKMHDLVHDLALSVSKFDTLIFQEDSTLTSNELPHILHLNIGCDDGEPLQKILTAVSPKLHSLFSEIDVFKKLPRTFGSLRVLKFSGSRDHLEFSASLGELKHLRYFEISRTCIYAVPRSTSKLYNLQTLKLSGSDSSCKSLPPLGHLPNLQFLKLGAMDNVERIGNEFYSNGKNEMITVFPVLKKFTLERMKRLEEWTALGATVMFPCLEELDISECNRLKSIGDGVATATHLKKIAIQGCSELEVVPIAGRCSSLLQLCISECLKLRKIGDGLSNSSCLKELSLKKCPNLSSIPDMEGFSSLLELKVESCDKLGVIPIAGRCSSLQKLNISRCEELRKIGDGLSASTCLKELYLERCPKLTSIPDLEGFSSLQRLEVVSCDKLERFPLKAPVSSLKQLRIRDCPILKVIPCMDGLYSLTRLNLTQVGEGFSCQLPNLLTSNTCLCSLRIFHLPHLKSIPDDSLSGLHCLEEMNIGGFWEELEEFPGLNSIQHLNVSLRVLRLIGWEKLKSLPHQIRHLTALEELCIEGFQGIEALPEWLGNLSSLKHLEIDSCYKLMYLPHVDVMRSLSNLQTLSIWSCPQLERCIKESGPEWSNISHIPNINIDYEWFKSEVQRSPPKRWSYVVENYEVRNQAAGKRSSCCLIL